MVVSIRHLCAVLHFTPSRLSVLLGALLLVGCDTTASERSVAPATAQSIALALEGRPNGDYFYDLAPLEVRERFEATLVGSAGALRLQFEGTGGGRGFIQLLTDDARPSEALSMDYIANGVVVATKSFEGSAQDTYKAGTADREPDSVHYVWYPNGAVSVSYDYNDDEDTDGAGTTMTALDGERIEGVTDIRFMVQDADLGEPEVLKLTTASALTLR
ncbi:MAG: hypothetical protein Rubg2KO_25490 [Rubricoccaceae bacterium]